MIRTFMYEVVKKDHDSNLASHGTFDNLEDAMAQIKKISGKQDKKAYSIRRTEKTEISEMKNQNQSVEETNLKRKRD